MEEEAALARLWVSMFIGGLLIGAMILGWVFILGPLFSQADYQQFNNSPQHIQAVAQKFSDDCLQLSEATTSTARKAIEQDIYSVSSTVDLNTVQMPSSTRQCVEQAIYDATH